MADHAPVSGDEPASPGLDEESRLLQPGGSSHADAAGAALIVIAVAGVIGFAWEVVRSQLLDDDPGSVGDRVELLLDVTVLLLLSAMVGGIGVGLRIMAATQTKSASRSVFGRPVGRMLLALTTALALLLAAPMLLESEDNQPIELNVPLQTAPDIEELIERQRAALASPELPMHILEVHSDGCGVIRTGEIGERLTWVVKDEDGFQVLGRNAAGDMRFRYFESGTYTVVLETWGGSYYVEVSNEVTINC